MSGLAATAEEITVSDLPAKIREAGVAGAGGAGFPSYAKWDRTDDVDQLLINHQESEPNYFIDKWIGKEHADELAALFEGLLENVFDTIVVAAKKKDRNEWVSDLEEAVDGTVIMPSELPVDFSNHSGVIFTYTNDKFQYGMESVLLNVVTDTTIGNDLPMDHGWIVQNTETLYNIYRAISDRGPITRKYVHIDGDGADHRFLDVPIGTPIDTVLEAAGRSLTGLGDDETIVTGGPGWCFELETSFDCYGIEKRTNCLMAVGSETIESNKLGGGRIQLIDDREWRTSDLDREPTEALTPERVHVPLITNPDIDHIVSPATPIVEVGDEVAVGDRVAKASDGISNPQHASINGTVADVADRHVTIDRR